MKEWEKWIQERQAESTMEVAPIDLAKVEGWEVDDKAVHRPDDSFFKVIGLRVKAAFGREVKSWDQVTLKESGGPGAIVLVYSEKGVLLQAKAEPGNNSQGCVLLAATLQVSKSNLEAAHGGKKPPRAELVDSKVKWFTLQQDGGRYLKKSNSYAIVDDYNSDIEPTKNERWFTLDELAAAILKGYANEHLVQAYAVLSGI
jgi:dTDP-4-dehydro-6-deoxy-alpha-D-glucopyranose 2,3-dehydratase